MREPLSWPYDSEATWRAWRDHLDQVREPPLHIGALKRDADAEIARIVRCREGRWEPKRPQLVPPRAGPEVVCGAKPQGLC
ncbi:MAG: hypothetical protein ACJ8BE_17255 [Microvirga sp.]|jgi:hypothetical protein